MSLDCCKVTVLLNPPSCRLMAGQDGRSLPDLRIFGALMVGQHALMIAAAMLFMGLKGLALGCLVW